MSASIRITPFGCNCGKLYKIRLYKEKLPLTIPFENLPPYIGAADLTIHNTSATITGLILQGSSRYTREHREDLYKTLRAEFPVLCAIHFHRHKPTHTSHHIIQLT